mmetsp:Transcript_6955/g.14418  ORF Transcript_6955/g.14418 Transcript_6955/m.14418 type:complete len:237 (-) Transcript_6955:935-1645(-)
MGSTVVGRCQCAKPLLPGGVPDCKLHLFPIYTHRLDFEVYSDGGRELIECVLREPQKDRALAHPRVTDEKNFELLIEQSGRCGHAPRRPPDLYYVEIKICSEAEHGAMCASRSNRCPRPRPVGTNRSQVNPFPSLTHLRPIPSVSRQHQLAPQPQGQPLPPSSPNPKTLHNFGSNVFLPPEETWDSTAPPCTIPMSIPHRVLNSSPGKQSYPHHGALIHYARKLFFFQSPPLTLPT